MSRKIQLSLAVVTRNRPDSLRRCLASLRESSLVPLEIIVSDDSDASRVADTENVAREFGCRYLPGPRRGLYANRNVAALACNGTHIRTVDDDQTFPRGHFEQCLARLEPAAQNLWTTGEITYIDGKRVGAVETANQLHPSGVGGPVSDRNNNWAIADGSTIYPRDVFDRGFRMVEAFGYGSSYLEFGAYLYRHGYASRCLPGVQVEHHPDAETFRRPEDVQVVKSRLFASLCFNLYFRPNVFLAVKYLSAYLFFRGRQWKLFSSLPGLLRLARERWTR